MIKDKNQLILFQSIKVLITIPIIVKYSRFLDSDPSPLSQSRFEIQEGALYHIQQQSAHRHTTPLALEARSTERQM